MPGKRLEYAVRARRDLEAIEKYHLEVAGDVVADRIIAEADDPATALEALSKARVPDMRRTVLHVERSVSDDDPFAI